MTAITSRQDVIDLMKFIVADKSSKNLKTGLDMVSNSRCWIQRLAWCHGHLSITDWPEQDYDFLRHTYEDMSKDKGLSGRAVGTRPAVRSSRHGLEESQMQRIYSFALSKLNKAQMLLHNVFASLTLQTAMRPLEMCNIVSLDLSMSIRSDLKFGPVKLFELGGVGKAKVNATSEKSVWVMRHPGISVDDPVYWMAASLMYDDCRLAEDGHGRFIDLVTSKKEGKSCSTTVPCQSCQWLPIPCN